MCRIWCNCPSWLLLLYSPTLHLHCSTIPQIWDIHADCKHSPTSLNPCCCTVQLTSARVEGNRQHTDNFAKQLQKSVAVILWGSESNNYSLRFLCFGVDKIARTGADASEANPKQENTNVNAWVWFCAGPSQECSGSDGFWGARGGQDEDECGGAAGEDEEKPGGFVAPREEEGNPIPLTLLQQRQPFYYPAGDAPLPPPLHTHINTHTVDV